MQLDSFLSRRKALFYIGTFGKTLISLPLLIGCKTLHLAHLASKEKMQKLSGSPLVFAHITDTHVGYPDVTEKRLFELVDQINNYKPAFVIHTGDVAHFDCIPEWKKFKKIFRSLQMPYYVVPGNHDTGELPTPESFRLWSEYMGAENFSFVESEVAFIGVNFTPFWQSDFENSDLQKNKRKEIIVWLNNELQKKRNCLARFIFGHFPLYLIDVEDDDYKNSISEHETRKQIIKIFVNGNCSAYFCGHTHFGWENTISLNDREWIHQKAITSLAYPALIRGLEKHKFLRERNSLGWYIWKYFPYTGKLKKKFIEIENKTKTIIFSRY